MRLDQLLPALGDIPSEHAPRLEITALTVDSRQVVEGALFVAVRGTVTDGHRFLQDAVREGAAAAVGEDPDPGLGVPYFRVADSRLALAQLAAAWHDHPAQGLTMIGVTGTDGKTTTTTLLHQIMVTAGLKTGMISSVSARIGDRTEETGLHVTTPGALQVQGLLAEMLRSGVSHCVLETTSHGLAQHRVSACDFDIGVVTNITHEHLDYHGSYEAYRESKGMLLTGLDADAVKPNGPAKAAVFNRDDASYSFLKKIAKVRQITFGLKKSADVVAKQIESGPTGLRFEVEWEGSRQTVRSPLVGEYNIANCLAAFAASVVGLGLSPQVVAEGISQVSGIPGRMETIDLGQPFSAVVDFAHTPNALRRALETARNLTDKRVIAVFGSAGLRDRAKRRMMAEISAQYADLTVLTAEDPRTEPLDSILEEMAEGARSRGAVEGKNFWRVPDRGQALRFAVGIAQDGDLVISCGKGHEQSMCFGEVEHPWDDRVAMRAALSELMGVDGPPMPHLPTSE